MPMSAPIHNRGNLKPADIAMLRRVLETACINRQIESGTEDAKELALTLLALFNAGMTDEDLLTTAVAFRIPGAGLEVQAGSD